MNTTKNEIVMALKSGTCTFTYKKMDGDVRVAMGTLNPNLIPAEARANMDTNTPGNVIKYYDMGAKGWRSFLTENVQTFSIPA